jgi:hypothetical protein
VHTSCESLHQDVTKDALPKEYGGNLDSVTSYHSKLRGTSTIGTTYPNYIRLLCLLGQVKVLKCNYRFLSLECRINPLTPSDPYSGRTAPLTSKVAFFIFLQQI